VAGWAGLTIAAGLALAGAARAPDGIVVGRPALPALALAAGVAALVVRWAGRPAAGPLAALAAVALAPLAAPWLRGLGAWTGPPLVALALGGVAVALASSPRRVPAGLFVPVVAAVYVMAAHRVQVRVGPEGDEPHYMMVADSLWRDGDLALERDFAEGRYRRFIDREIEPHYRVRGRDGRIYSLHAVGLSLLLVPAVALGGYPAASYFMAALAVVLVTELRRLLREATAARASAEAVAWVLALSPPLVHYAGLVFTEVPAALAVAVGLRRLRDLRSRGVAEVLTAAMALAFLPWLNVRYALLSAVLLAWGLWQRPDRRRLVALLGPSLVSAVALSLYHQSLYGFADPRRVYGPRPELSLAAVPHGLGGLLFDQEFGLLVHAPLFVLALPGGLALLRTRRRDAVAAVSLAAAAVLTAASWHMWRGGFNPPARFLVPVVPALALGVGQALGRGFGAAPALLVGWSLWCGLAGAARPELVHRDRDGTAPLFRTMAGAEEWTRLLPGYVLDEGARDRIPLTLVWGAVLALAALSSWSPRATGRGMAAALAVLGVAAAGAARLATASTGGRDAVRVLGRAGVLFPRLGLSRCPPARWSTADLGWGPAYEAHRFPDGAPIGARLPLVPGRYRFLLTGETLGPVPPSLTVQGAGTRPRAAFALSAVTGGWAAELSVLEGRETSLLFSGGSAVIIDQIELTSLNLCEDGRSKSVKESTERP
jgi:hypothetical protein